MDILNNLKLNRN